MIRVWSREGRVKHEWVGHKDIVRAFSEIPGLGIVSVSNDETGKVWSYTGDLLYELIGHQGFVFCVTTLSNGDIATGSDDKTLKIWRGQ
jgi:phospholipase A-2-activating protein